MKSEGWPEAWRRWTARRQLRRVRFENGGHYRFDAHGLTLVGKVKHEFDPPWTLLVEAFLSGDLKPTPGKVWVAWRAAQKRGGVRVGPWLNQYPAEYFRRAYRPCRCNMEPW